MKFCVRNPQITYKFLWPCLVWLLAVLACFPVFASGEKQDLPTMVETFYAARDSKPLWFRGGGAFQPQVDAVIKTLDESWTHGLNPQDYDVEKLKSYKAVAQSEGRITLDKTITESVLRYMNDMAGVRLGKYDFDIKTRYWREPLDQQKVLNDLSQSSNPSLVMKSVEPTGKLYTALKRELVEILKLPKEKNFKPIRLNLPIKPEKMNAKISEIRARFGLKTPDQNPNLYDEALAIEVMKLQKSYGLDTDGIIFGRTLNIINMTKENKAAQIIANMERLRWMGEVRPDRYVLVNIPSASLWAVDGGDVKLEMPVIIGKTARPTNSFKTQITGVRFNPNWTVPPTIKNEDFLPALQVDPLALAKRGISISYAGEVVDPTTVDWNNVTSRGMANLHLVQNPGDDNPLGKVRVIMENPFNIYLHDTNHREAFDKDERALSSGCIRVSKPEKLADFILQKNDGWSWDGMEKIISKGSMRDISIKNPIPIYILYQTVWLDENGRIVYGRDVYGQDSKLYNSLKTAKKIYLPQQSEAMQITL